MQCLHNGASLGHYLYNRHTAIQDDRVKYVDVAGTFNLKNYEFVFQNWTRHRVVINNFTGRVFIYEKTGFYHTALEGCRGIVFTHGVQMGRRVGGRSAGKVCPGCISETVRCRKLILGRDIG